MATTSAKLSLLRPLALLRTPTASRCHVTSAQVCIHPNSFQQSRQPGSLFLLRRPIRKYRSVALQERRGLVCMATQSGKEPVVDAKWLSENLKNVKVLDASWYMPAEKRKPLEEYHSARVPGAIFFDIDKIADPNTNLPHMLPSEAAFSSAASALGLSNDDDIIVYDGKGMFSAPRVWWMFRVFGHESVRVLQGGLPGWKSFGYKLENDFCEENDKKAKAAVEAVARATQGESGSFKAKLRPDLVRSMDEVLQVVENKNAQIVDARGKGRFKGEEAEPRAGVRGGHMPGAKNVPFTQVLTAEGFLRDSEALSSVFKEADVDLNKPLLTSCGTGVTACVLALALYKLGKKAVPVYDGSWTEWGGSSTTPVVKD